MKKKILIISIIAIILIIITSVTIYKLIQSKASDTVTNVSNINTKENVKEEAKEENIETDEKILENTEDKDVKLINDNKQIETKEERTTQTAQETREKNIQVNTKKSTNEKTNLETQKTNNHDVVTNNVQQTQTNTKEETKVPETKKIDLSKYSRYENALNGGYKAYMKNDSEMNKLKSLIDTCVKEFGYTNVKVIPNSSIVGSTQSFTANKTNVGNKVYNSEDFTIYYYAETEYHITAEGTESVFQYRSYIKVQ